MVADTTVRDYLGHPCEVTRAFERFDDPIDEARKLDPKALVRQIGMRLNSLADRSDYFGFALEFARDTDTGDADKLRGLLALAVPFEVDSANQLFELAGYVLVALEQGKLWENGND